MDEGNIYMYVCMYMYVYVCRKEGRKEGSRVKESVSININM